MNHASGADPSVRPPLFQSPAPREGIALIVRTHTPAGSIPINETISLSYDVCDRVKWGLLAEGYSAETMFKVEACETAFTFSRGLRWADLPVITDPSYGYDHARFYTVLPETKGTISESGSTFKGDFDAAERKNAALREFVCDNLRNVTRVHVVRTSSDDLTFWHAMAPVITSNPNAWVSTSEDGVHREVSMEEVASLREKCRAHDRLTFNHIFNMSIMGSRAIFDAARHSSDPRRHVMFSPKVHNISDNDRVRSWDRFEVFSPLSTQMLIALADELGQPVDIRDDDAGLMSLDIAPMLRTRFVEEFDSKEGHLVWKGTGKFPEARTLLWKSRSLPRFGAFELFRPLVWIGAVAVIDGEPRITSFGKALVEGLGRKARDPDVLLRWRTAEGFLAAPGDMPTVDRWLVRYLRAVKRSVADLPSSPLTEPDQPWREAEPNSMIVRGAIFDIRTMDDADTKVLVNRIAEENKDKLDTECEVGVLFDESAIASLKKPTSIWVGRPMTVVPRHHHYGPYNSAGDSSNIDLALAEKVSAWQDMLGIRPARFRFFKAPTTAALTTLETVPSRFGSIGADNALAVYRGALITDHEAVKLWVRGSSTPRLRDLVREAWNGDRADIDSPACLIPLDKNEFGRAIGKKRALLIGQRIGVAAFPTTKSFVSKRQDIDITIPNVHVLLDENPDEARSPDLLLEECVTAAAAKFPAGYFGVRRGMIYELTGDPASGIMTARPR